MAADDKIFLDFHAEGSPLKLGTFEIRTPAGPLRRIGAAVDGRLIDFAASYAAHLDRTAAGCEEQKIAALLFPPDMVAFLELGELGRNAALEAIAAASKVDEAFGARTSYGVDEVRILAPVARPRVIRDFLTFEGHMKQASRALGRGDQIPQAWYEVPAYYKGDCDTVVGTGVDIVWPAYCEKFDFELELGMVTGRRGKNIAKADAHRYIAGYTIWNDWSARDQQMREAPVGMGPSKGKDFDTGNGVGPYLVTADEMDVSNARMIARINGEVWTDSSSAGRQFSFEDLIVHVSQSETIHAGELWGSGTVTGGSGLELNRWLKPGDLVELEIEGIGVLSNRIVR
jgi:2-keto-4-pentenoate hydratase/2-oxohepta-3-ene-1,7-dioic acid hydratase in catechol pathway